MKEKLFHFFSILDIIKLYSNKDVFFMDYEFSSLKDLYFRVEPALDAKRVELERLGYSDIKNVDIWNFLVEYKWKKGKGLMLSDIVSDILNTECHLINNYFKEKKDNIKNDYLDDRDII